MNSGTVFAGTVGFTSMTLGTRTMPETIARSRTGLNLSFWCSVALMALAARTTRSV